LCPFKSVVPGFGGYWFGDAAVAQAAGRSRWRVLDAIRLRAGLADDPERTNGDVEEPEDGYRSDGRVAAAEPERSGH
jgi:hypothetical protein